MYKIEFLLRSEEVEADGYYVRDPENMLHFAGPHYGKAQELIATLICNPKKSLTDQIWEMEQQIHEIDKQRAELEQKRQQVLDAKEGLLLKRRQTRNYFVFDSYDGVDRKYAKFGPAPLQTCLDWVQKQYPRKTFGPVNWTKDWWGFTMAPMVGGFYALVWEEEVNE